VDEKDIVLLEGLLSRESPTGEEGPAAEYLVDEMRGRGFEARTDRTGNAVGKAGRADAPLHIALVGHIDTVPGKLPVRNDGGRITGRGAVDAKGPLCAFVAAAANFVGSENVHLTVVGAVAEEGDSRGALHLAKDPAPDFCIIGEPSGWDGVVIGYRGSMQLSVSTRCAKAHGSRGVPTPSENIVDFWGRVKELVRPHTGGSVFESLDARLAGIHSDDTGLEEACTALLRFRTPPAFDLEAFASAVGKAGEGLSLEWREKVPAVLVSPRQPLVGAFNAAIRDEGGRPRHCRRSGTSDMNILGPRWNCPILAYGPGDSSLDHTPGECLRLEDFDRAVRVLRQVISRLAGPPATTGP
jgi:LysW-gamma-L-lysine carboxypeptidase